MNELEQVQKKIKDQLLQMEASWQKTVDANNLNSLSLGFESNLELINDFINSFEKSHKKVIGLSRNSEEISIMDKLLKQIRNITLIAERQLSLLNPNSEKELIATLKWMSQKGQVEDLRLLYLVKHNLPFSSSPIPQLFKIATQSIEQRLKKEGFSRYQVFCSEDKIK